MRIKQWPKKAIQIYIPVYDQYFYLIRDKKVYDEALEFLGLPSSAHSSKGKAQWSQHTKTGETVFMIGVFEPNLGVLVHELCHLEKFLAEFIGLKADDDEAHCYLLEYMFNQCRKYINEY